MLHYKGIFHLIYTDNVLHRTVSMSRVTRFYLNNNHYCQAAGGGKNKQNQQQKQPKES